VTSKPIDNSGKMQALKKYFVGGSAELERKIRNQVFVKTSAVEKIISNLDSDFLVFKSPKGIGKTYIVDELIATSLEQGYIAVKVTPDTLDIEKIALAKSLAGKSKVAYFEIVRQIALQIGRTFERNKIITDESSTNLYHYLIENGEERPDFLTKLKSFFAALAPRGPEIAKALRDFLPTASSTSILSTDIVKYLDGNKKSVYVFFDDVDLAATIEDGVDYANCWAIISAAFDVCSRIDNVKSVVSIRSDVWYTMQRRKIGTDRRDKMTSVIDLMCNDSDVYNILMKRFCAAAHECNLLTASAWEHFFEKHDLQLPGKQEESRPWITWLCKQSRGRPRDAVQLVEALAKIASEGKSDVIKSGHAQNYMLPFAETRLRNIAGEFSVVCSELEFIVKSIKQNIFSFEEAVKFFKSVPSMRNITIDGESLAPDKSESAIKILNLLHNANVVNPRITDESMPRGFDHILFQGNEALVTPENMPSLAKYKFEVHPVFHAMIASKSMV
jgi:hypothetical protein